MSLSNKELLDQCKGDVLKAHTKHWPRPATWDVLGPETKEMLWPVIAERYASEKAKEAVRASERLRVQDAASAINEANSLRSKIEEQELIIHGITEGADEWRSKCADLEREKAAMFTRSEVESCIKDSLEAAAENAKIESWVHDFYGEKDTRYRIVKSSITDTKNIKIK